MKHILVALFLTFFASIATAADVRITCTGPSQYTDNTPIPAGTPILYTLYGGLQGQTKTELAEGATCNFLRSNVAPGTQEYQITATIAGVESDRSNTGSVVVPVPTPKAPGGITVTIQVTVATP